MALAMAGAVQAAGGADLLLFHAHQKVRSPCQKVGSLPLLDQKAAGFRQVPRLKIGKGF
jgi:hypothetical protein